MVNVFSIPAFFIVLREVLEACLVVSIVLAYLGKVGATQYRKWVWIGTGAGIGVAILVGLAFGIVFFVNDNQLFKGNAEKIFEGVTFLIAAALLTWMIIWMMVIGKTIRTKLEQKVEGIVESEKSPRKRKISIFFMIFVQVLREGIETVIFLIGTSNADEIGGWRGIPLAGVLALIVGVFASFLVFKGLVNANITAFFLISGFVLIAFAAGLVSHAFHELQEVDWFGPWKPENGLRDWYNAPLWNTEGCCDDGSNEFFAMLRALFGYQDLPTFVEWATYFAYWLIIIAIFVVINWAEIRSARSKVASKTQAFALLSLLFTFVAWIYTLLNRTWIGILTMTLGFVLSIAAVYVVFDITAKLIRPLFSARRNMVLATGILMSMLTMFMFVLHIVEMECLGTPRDNPSCSLDTFFFFGLIFDPEFLATGRNVEDKTWHSLAALSFSVVLTVYFFGAFSLLLILYSLNVSNNGDYIHDDAVGIKGGDSEEELMGKLDSTDAENAEDSNQTPISA